MPAEIDRREPDAAGGAMHQQPLAGFQPRPAHQRDIGGEIGDGEGGGLRITNARRDQCRFAVAATCISSA